MAANEALLEIASVVGAPEGDRRLIAGWARRGHAGLEACWDPDLGLCLDYDVSIGRPIRSRTIAGFAPLISGGVTVERLADLLLRFDSPDFTGSAMLRRPLPPATSPDEKRFDPRSYWRGPVWPITNWLLWWSLERAGASDRASRIRRASLDQIAEGGFAEYFEPFTGEPLGSPDQSWTAAVVLDWLLAEPARVEAEAA